MSEKIELFERALKFTPLLGILDLFFLLHFFISWYRSAKKTGWKIDFWFLNLFLACVLNTCILYPFSASIYQNAMTLGYYEKLEPFVDRAFLISLLGYSFVWLGRYWHDLTANRGTFGKLFALFTPFSHVIERNVKSTKVVLSLTSLTFLIGTALFFMQFQAGEFFNLRGYCLKSDLLRPLFNAASTIFPIALSVLALRYLQERRKVYSFLFVVLLLLTLSFGMRGLLVINLLFFILYRLYQREGRFQWKWLLSVCSLLFFIAVYLSQLRSGIHDMGSAAARFFFHLLYGNNFSDTRDFAWLLSFWDGEYFYGKTYVAGFFSFIPRSLSALRQEWSFSIVTNSWIGFDSLEMPGLRPGTFGEMFFNFGLVGVMLYGFVFGYALRFADSRLKQAIEIDRDVIKGYAQTFAFTCILQMNISSGLWGLYIFIFAHALLALYRKIRFTTLNYR